MGEGEGRHEWVPAAAGTALALRCTKEGQLTWSQQDSPGLEHSANVSVGVLSVLP